jgi:SAM-dependent methyltransferase
MVEQYNTLMLNQGIPSSEMRAVTGNLLSPTDPNPAHLNAPEYFNFDIAAVGMGFHHFTDPTYAAKQLVQRLKPGGVLFIVDFKPHAPLEHSHHHSHDHSHEHSHSHEKQGEKPKVDEEEEVGKNAAHTVLHHGFSPETVKKMFEEAGAGKGYEYLEIGDGIVMHGVKEGGEPMKRSLFFARGEKL